MVPATRRERPRAATFAHHADARRRWDASNSRPPGGARVYPPTAPTLPPRTGSHGAGGPRPHDGLGPARPRLATIDDDGPGWPGRWGATAGASLRADSPAPAREHPHWWDPAELHAEAQPAARARSPATAPGTDPAERAGAGDLAIVS